MNLLIPYVHLYNHPDPLFEEFTYGDNRRRARKLKKDLEKGNYVFFHTSIKGKKYITAYYVVDRVLDTAEAIKNKNIVAKYNNPHIREFVSDERTDKEDDVVLFGDPITSKVLDRPLLFNKALAEKLSLDIKFPPGRTETQAIGWATRSWRELSDKDVEILFDAIKEQEPPDIAAILSTDEVTEVIEKDIENFIAENASLIGESLQSRGRQLAIPQCRDRIDLLFEDEEANLIIVELKLNKIGRAAISQLRKYMNGLKKETKKEVTGVVVCKGVMPAFEKDLKNLKDIKIFRYGWQLVIVSET